MFQIFIFKLSEIEDINIRINSKWNLMDRLDFLMPIIGFIHMRNKSPLSTAKSGNLSPQIFHGSQI
jgi:hypothetical protein